MTNDEFEYVIARHKAGRPVSLSFDIETFSRDKCIDFKWKDPRTKDLLTNNRNYYIHTSEWSNHIQFVGIDVHVDVVHERIVAEVKPDFSGTEISKKYIYFNKPPKYLGSLL